MYCQSNILKCLRSHDGGYLQPLGLQGLVVTMEAHEVTHGPGQDIGQGADPAHRAHGQRRQEERGGASNHLKSWHGEIHIPTFNSNFDVYKFVM